MMDSNRSLSWASALGLLHLVFVLIMALHRLQYLGRQGNAVIAVLHMAAICLAVVLIYLPCNRAHVNKTLVSLSKSAKSESQTKF